MQLLKLYSTDKQIFITREKVGSRYILSSFNEPNIYNFELSDDFKSVAPSHGLPITDKVNEIVKDFDLAINKKSKKDIVIFYRKPNEKLKSGIIQDFYSIFNENGGNSFLVKLIFKHLNASDEVQRFVLDNSYQIRFMTVDEIPEPVLAFYKSALSLYLEHMSTNGFNDTHCGNYLYILYALIFGNLLDTNKLILCDLDMCDADELFESLNMNPVKESRSSNNEFKNILHDLLQNNTIFRTRFDTKIESELIMYNMIKLHERNFKNKSK